jgi:hypothetical protein
MAILLQAKSWYDHMAAGLKHLGFVVVEGWDSVFVRRSVLLMIYVDDSEDVTTQGIVSS